MTVLRALAEFSRKIVQSLRICNVISYVQESCSPLRRGWQWVGCHVGIGWATYQGEVVLKRGADLVICRGGNALDTTTAGETSVSSLVSSQLLCSCNTITVRVQVPKQLQLQSPGCTSWLEARQEKPTFHTLKVRYAMSIR